MPTKLIGICEPMRTEHPFGLGVAWRMVGQPMGAFYPFLSGRDDFGRWPGSAGSAITEWMWCSDKQDGLNALGTPWPAAATACGNGWGVAAGAAFWSGSTCPVCGRRRAAFKVLDQAGEHGKPGAFEVLGVARQRPGLVNVEADDRPITRDV